MISDEVVRPDLSLAEKRVVSYYLLYSLLFVFIHMGLSSFVAFLNFQVGHDMSAIEEWLTQNGHDILFVSKFISLFVVVRAVRLNYYQVLRLRDLLKSASWWPHLEGVVLFIFLMIMGMANSYFISEDSFTENVIYYNRTFVSFVGCFSFYFLDIICLFYLRRSLGMSASKKGQFISFLLVFILFTFSYYLALPHLQLDSFYFSFFFLFLISILWWRRSPLGDILLVLSLVIAPMSVIFGYDIVWNQEYQLLVPKVELPLNPILFIWPLAMAFYFYQSKTASKSKTL